MRLILALIVYFAPILASAGTTTGTLQITARVVASCSVATQPLTLADHPTGSAQSTGTQSAGQINLRCTRGLPVAIAIDQGPLTGPDGATLAYTLSAPTSAVGQGAQIVALPVTGSVQGGQVVPVGEYQGTAIVRVTY